MIIILDKVGNTALSRPESSRKDSKHWMQSVRPIGISYKVASCRRNVYSANRSNISKSHRIASCRRNLSYHKNGEFASNRRVCQRTSSVNRLMTVDGIVQTRCLMRQKSWESLPWSCWWRENRTASVPSRRNVEKIENPASSKRTIQVVEISTFEKRSKSINKMSQFAIYKIAN